MEATPPAKPSLTSPKLSRTRPSGTTSTSLLPTASFGCEHVQSLLNENYKLSLQHFTSLQQTTSERNPVVPQTHRLSKSSSDTFASTSLRPTYLCLQCPNISTPENRDRHWELKQHGFSIESRQGCLYCQQCKDFVYDPTLEEIRSTKRKYDEMVNGEEGKLAHTNASFIPCRAMGLRGLWNMGQTCFMSVIIQSLIHNPIIKLHYLSEGHRSSDCTQENCLSCGMDDVFTELYSNEKAEGISVVNMLVSSWLGAQTLSASSLAGYQQQDAHEYMQVFLNLLHNSSHPDTHSPTNTSDSNPANCPCLVHRTFAGQLQSTVTCTSCKNVTRALDPFLDLSLDLRQRLAKANAMPNGGSSSSSKSSGADDDTAPLNLQTSLARFTAPELLPATSYTCSRCTASAAGARKQLLLRRLPPVLVIHLKRFEHSAPGSAAGNSTAGGGGGAGNSSKAHNSGGSGGGGGGAGSGGSGGAGIASASKITTPLGFPMTLDVYPYTVQSAERRGGGGTSPRKAAGANGAGPADTDTDDVDDEALRGTSNRTADDGERAAGGRAAGALLYQLSSVVVHIGKIDTGHYVAYAREGADWFLFDDNKVTAVDESEVLAAEGYLLFYVVRDVP